MKTKTQTPNIHTPTPRFRRRGLRLIATASVLAAASLSASAALVTNTLTDVPNTSSFAGGMGATNWDNLLPPAAGNDYFVTAGRALRTPTNGVVDLTKYTFAGSSLTLGAGTTGGSLGFKCSNVVTVANLILTNGTINNSAGGANPDVVRIAGNILVATNGFLAPSETNRSIKVTATISGSGGLTVSGKGTATLSGAHPYNGPVTITGTMLEWDTNAVMTPSALFVGKDTTLVGITNAGWVTNGLPQWSTNVYNSTNIVRRGGNLNVGYGPAGDLRVGWRANSNTNNNVVALFDVSLQPQFNANVGNFIVGYSSAGSTSTRASAAGLVYLATNNTILATNITIADTVEAVSTTNTLVVLGKGSNYVDTPIMVVGARKQVATLTLPVGGKLVLTNSASGRMDLTVGGNAAGTSGNPTDLMDLTGGPVSASLGNLVIGLKSGTPVTANTGGATATLTLATNSANAVDVNSVTLGSMAGNISGTTAAAGTLNLNGGTVRVNNDISLAVWDLTAGAAVGVLNLNGGTMSVGGNFVNGGGTATLALNAGTLDVAGDIQNSLGGTTTINLNGGLLDLQPAGDAAPGSLAANTLVLKGTITNANVILVTDLSGTGASVSQTGVLTATGTLNPGTATTAGTLTSGSLTLDSGAVWHVNLAASSTPGGSVNDLLVVNGDLSFPNASLTIAQLTSTLDTTTPYVLATYTGTLSGLPTYPATLGRYLLSLVADESTMPRRLTLVVSGNPASLLWTGTTDGQTWDVNNVPNWQNLGTAAADTFLDNDKVLFDDSSPYYYDSVNLTVDVQPGSMIVSNDVNPYVFASSTANGIAGPGGLTKYGTAALTLNTSNTFTGPVAINAGLVVAGAGTAFGATSSGTTIASGATLDVNNQILGTELIHVQGVGYDGNGAIINSDSTNPLGARNATRYVVLDGPTTFGTPYRWDVHGTGAASSAFLQGGSYSLIKTGASVLALSAGCDVTVGDIFINQGTLAFETGSTMNPGYGITVNSGASLALYQLVTPLGRNVTMQNGATLSGNSSGAANQNQLTGSLTLNGLGNLNAGGGASNILAGPVTGPGNLVKLGAGITTLTSTANNWAGGTLISAGILQVGSGGADGSLPNQPLTNNATLMYNSSNPLTLTAPITGPGTWQLQATGLVTLAGQITGANRFNVYSNGNMTVQGTIDTANGILKYGYGTLTLASSNSFTGNVKAGDGGPTTQGTAGGIIRLLNPYGFGDPSISKTVTVIRAEIHLEGGMTIATNVYLQTSTWSGSTGEGAGLIAIRSTGTNTIPNTVEVIAGSGSSEYRSDAGLLVFDGPIFLGNSSSRSAIFSGAGNGIVNGVLSNQDTNALTVEKNGTGTWILTAPSTYTGPTLVRAGTLVVNGNLSGGGPVTVQTNATLAGTGALAGSVTVSLGGTLAPGTSIGTLTLGSNLTIQGKAVMEVARNGSVLSHDLVTGIVTNTYGGTLIVTNVGASALQPGDSFKLFTATTYLGGFTNIVYPSGYNWTNNLAVDGTVGVASLSGSPTLHYTASGSGLTFSWTGAYKLQAQTNALSIGISNNWQDVPGGSASGVSVPVDPSNDTVFFRLTQ